MKKILTIALMLCSFCGVMAQDKKVAIASATASASQPGEEAKYAIDGNYNTMWHSPYSGTNFNTLTFTVKLKEVSKVDYVKYVPRCDNSDNGNWIKVEVLYSEKTSGSTFTSIGTYQPNGASTPTEFDLGGVECGQIRFKIKGGYFNVASAAEIEVYQIDNTKREAFATYFSDDLYSELKPEVTSSEGIEDADVKQLVDNLLTDADAYKKFRVGEYEAYMPTSTLKNMLKVSSQYNNYENPTGVYLKTGESCIVVASGIGSSAVGLKIKNWYTNENSSEYGLKNGFNYITAASEGNVFVDYYTSNFETAPKVKLHFINAPVQGYWDQETMTNADWVEMLKGKKADDHSIIITRSKHAQTAYPVSAWLQHCPTNVDSTMTLYQQVQWAERDILGLERYGKQVKNRQLFYATNYGFMAAGGEGSYCEYGSLGGIMRPDSKNFDFWGVGHEWGHNNQVTPGFKWSGCGETTNNIYAAWAQLHGTGNRHSLRLEDEVSGVNDYSGMRGGRFQTYFEEGLRKGIAWQLQDGPDYHGATPNEITVQGQDANGKNTGTVKTTSRNYDHFVKLAPFWQLTLWGTLAGKCPDIVPMVIESIRTTDNYGSTYNTNGKQQINWMKIACDSTKINLLPFFEKAGMLRPINAYIEDYGAGWNIINEKMINDLKAHVAKQGYADFTEEINYINAHNFHIYRDNLKLEVPSTLGTGCSYSSGKVKVQHAQVKNAVAFETYNTNDELVRITMYGLGGDDAHSFTQVLYPGSTEDNEASAYIMAVGYDGTRTKIYENLNKVVSLEPNHYYRITSNGKGNTLTCGAGSEIATDGTITWKLERTANSTSKIDQIWCWEKRDGETYLFSPQSKSYLGGQGSSQITELLSQASAPKWNAVCIDTEKNLYVLEMQGTGQYLNAYSDKNTGFWSGGESDANNIWKIQEVKFISISVPESGLVNYCMPFAVSLEEGLTAYTISGYETLNYEGAAYDYALLEPIQGNVVPAYEAVIFGAEKGSYRLTLVPGDETTISQKNILHGVGIKQRFDRSKILSTFKNAEEAGTTSYIGAATTTTVNVNKCYILKEDVNDLTKLYLAEKSDITAISLPNIEPAREQKLYTIDGKKVDKLQSGKIYITAEGKKILVK